MDFVYSVDPDIVITEVEDDESELSIFYIFHEGLQMAIAYDVAEAREAAAEVYAAITGEDQEEEPY